MSCRGGEGQKYYCIWRAVIHTKQAAEDVCMAWTTDNQGRRSCTTSPATSPSVEHASYGAVVLSPAAKEHIGVGGGTFLPVLPVIVDAGCPPDVEVPPAYAEAVETDSRSRASVSNIVSAMFNVSRVVMRWLWHMCGLLVIV